MSEERKREISIWKRLRPDSFQAGVLAAFTSVTLVLVVFLGTTLYFRFSSRYEQTLTDNTEQLLLQSAVNMEDYLVNMRRLSDAMYYDAIKGTDLRYENVNSELNLLYEANKDNLISIALFRRNGDLVAATPVSALKENPSVTNSSWFTQAIERVENFHFSMPHVQNLFEDATHRYNWVISLSRAVELTDTGVPMMGVLVVDMNYATIYKMMERLNEATTHQYYYLCDAEGNIIYHPRKVQIAAGGVSENSRKAAEYEDGLTKETFEGEERSVIVTSVSYTGWKLVGVIPRSAFAFGMTSTRYFVLLTVLLTLIGMLLITGLISKQISKPLIRLNDSVKNFKEGKKPEIYIGGSDEVKHLGETLEDSFTRINHLMDDVVKEQEEKRKSELDALQSQINPHFLYNALDSIVWMIEGEKNEEAVFMVKQLARLFRISISKGKNIISIEDEIAHAKAYMNIQNVRFKNAFTVEYNIDDEILTYSTVKLIIQPLLENAIYYGVQDLGGDGEIHVRGYKQGGDIYIVVKDNGLGMPQEEANLLLTGSEKVHKHGSGVGVFNVHRRIQIRYGERYGLTFKSEPDEGCEVTIHLPAF